jgi:hypothetical protein
MFEMPSPWVETGLGAHGAPARERRGVQGPRERPSRGVGRSPTWERTSSD